MATMLRSGTARVVLVGSAMERSAMAGNNSRAVWDADDCALIFMDYQDNVLADVFEQDRRVVELNARALAAAALDFKIPVILSTVGVEMGVNGPTIASLQAALPNIKSVDRSSMNSWEDAAFVAAVKATNRKRLVMCGIVTSVCLAYPVVGALADGYEVMFVEDAVADTYKESHDIAVLRLTQAGAVPNTTIPMIAEWFRDWKSPRADTARKLYVPHFEELARLKKAPEVQGPRGLAIPQHAATV